MNKKYLLYVKEENRKLYFVVEDTTKVVFYKGTFLLPEIFDNVTEFFNFIENKQPIFELENLDTLIVLYFYKYQEKIGFLEFILKTYFNTYVIETTIK